ncbi:MAG: TraR/DksA C4-type zinc finger protein [Planctomycetes bacterium]|nr:TraR/DksA C4-type zinc finger protein [Planctomycetota bacterium]
MKREELDRYRSQLRALTDRVRGTAAGLEEQVRTPTGGESAGGISNAPMHLADVGSEAYAQELSATLLENETYIRDEAVAALERLDRGAYGRCENCGRDIPHERLDAVPYTRYCTPCAAKLQEGRRVNLNDGRPDAWLGEPGHEGLDQTGSPNRVVGRTLGGAPEDVHAVGTPGGGTAVGGLAGTNVGGGAPDTALLEAAMGDGRTDAPIETDGEDQPEAISGHSGGAVGGTPANKRARGGRAKSEEEPKSPKKGRSKRARE